MKLSLFRFLLSSVALSGAIAQLASAQSQLVAWGSFADLVSNVPALPPGRTYAAVSVGQNHVVALRSDGSAVAWGVNDRGQCNVPALPPGLTFVETAGGNDYTLARRSDGSVVAWGWNDHGQCNVPALPAGLTYVQVSAGVMHSVARRSDGSVVAWGANSNGQCNVPALPPGLHYLQVVAGYYFNVARRSDGSVVAWGANSSGQCNVPALPPGLSYVGLAAGERHAIALRSDGSALAWGDDLYGQCDVPGLPSGIVYTHVYAGGLYSLAARSDNSLLAWGATGNVPALPAGFSYADVAASSLFSIARVDSGDCNGNGVDDQLDVQSGTSADCDANGLPDECQTPLVGPDCDGNGLLDPCEIAGNPTLDLDHDGALDACPLECHEYWDAISGGAPGIYGTVYAMAGFDDGTGPALYVAGWFQNAGGVAVNNIAKWDGSAWHSVGTGLSGGNVFALAVYDDGSGPALYAGGTFTSAGGTQAIRVARWDGLGWTALGAGPSGAVRALAVYDDGTGAGLFTAGAHSIDRWNGSSWAHIPSWTTSGNDDFTNVLCVYHPATGPKLYVGGADAVPSATLHAWDGSNWTSVPHPTNSDQTLALGTHDDGHGHALYIGTSFQGVGGIGRWDGTNLTPLGPGLGHTFGYYAVDAIQAFDDGRGGALFVGGRFTIPIPNPTQSTDYIAKWDGATWSPLGSGMNGQVRCMCVFDDGAGPQLYVGGDFTIAGGLVANHIARWGMASGCWHGVICEPGRSGVMSCPCGNPPSGLGRGCDNGAQTGGAQLRATGGASLAHESLVLTTSGETPTATSIVLQGSAHASLGAAFGHGVHCVSGTLKRLYLKAAASGAISAPGPGDLSVSTRSTLLGDPISPGTHRYYGVYYRDPIQVGGCPAASGFNITQQLDVLWQP